MLEKEISSFEEYISLPSWGTKTMIYRGVKDKNFQLIPSGLREPVAGLPVEDYLAGMLDEFKMRAYPYLKSVPKTDLEWMFLAQHYGIKTNLLDWTTNPLIALFFAVEEDAASDFAVYKRIQTNWLVGYEWKLDGGDDSYDINEMAVSPPHVDVRYINQSGLFTVHKRPISKSFERSTCKYTFSASLREDFRFRLAKMGVKYNFVYPGLDSLAKDIIREHKYIRDGGFVPGSGLGNWW